MTLGFVYKIYHTSNPDVFYVGSTKEQLTQRMQKHKCCARSKTNEKSKWFEYLRQHNYENFRIVLLDSIDYNHKSQLRELEDRYIRELKPQLNTYCAVLDHEDRKQRDYQRNQKPERKEYNQHYFQEYNAQKAFVCEFCNFGCARETAFNDHLATVKHRRAVEQAVDNGEECIYTGFTEEEVLQFHAEVVELD